MPTPLKVTPLTPELKRKWIETRSALMWKCPAFTHILFSMLNPTDGDLVAMFVDDPKEVPIAATDGSNLILNPTTFFTFSLDERVFIVAHEILHCIYNHCSIGRTMSKAGKVSYVDGSSLPYDHDTMNIAMDLVINDVLVHDKIGKFPTVGVHDPKIATLNDTFMDAYKKVWKKKDDFKGKGFDKLLQPGAGQGQDPGQAQSDRSQTEWDTAVAAAMASAKLQGKLPANLARLFTEIVEPTVSWQDHIRAFFARKVGSGGYNWRKPDRQLIQRDIYSPQRSGNGCEGVVLAVDTSGSIGQKELDVFFGEMRGILEDVRPRTLYVMWCDARVHKVDEVEDGGDIDTLKPHGGGGTDFKPVFAKIEEMGLKPDALVYLTDGYGGFPSAAPTGYPVIWGDIAGGVKYPFGDVVKIEIK
jgi:predicted metal-dependent peptidase